MIFSAHQPNFFPWVPFWIKVDTADVFGLMHAVQYSKGAYHNRVKIDEDGPGLLTIPVSVKLGQRIDQARIAQTIRPDKIIKRLRAKYERAPFWPHYGAELLELLTAYREGHSLYQANATSLLWLADKLEIDTKIVEVESASFIDPAETLASWCSYHRCDTYLSGSGAEQYLRTAPFSAREVTILYSKPTIAPAYATTSVLTALFNLGPDWRSCIKPKMEKPHGDV